MTTPITAVTTPIQTSSPLNVGTLNNTSAKPGAYFGDLLKNLGSEALQSNKHAEEMAHAYANGQVDLTDLSFQFSNANLHFNTFRTILSETVQAVREVTQMQI